MATIVFVFKDDWSNRTVGVLPLSLPPGRHAFEQACAMYARNVRPKNGPTDLLFWEPSWRPVRGQVIVRVARGNRYASALLPSTLKLTSGTREYAHVA